MPFQVLDKVMVPRSDGTQTPGVINYIIGEEAICSFVVGDTYQGKRAPDHLKGREATKRVLLSNLQPIPDSAV